LHTHALIAFNGCAMEMHGALALVKGDGLNHGCSRFRRDLADEIVCFWPTGGAVRAGQQNASWTDIHQLAATRALPMFAGIAMPRIAIKANALQTF